MFWIKKHHKIWKRPTATWLKSQLLSKDHFGVINEGFRDYRFLAGALPIGETGMRIGFKDGTMYVFGKSSRSKLELVQKAADLIHFLDLELMTLEEAKEYMG